MVELDEGVSEVVGELLLLAIVVVVMAVLSSNISTLIPSVEDAPYARFIGFNEGNITILHEGGESLQLTDLRIVVEGNETTQCVFDGSMLVCDGNAAGELSDDGNGCWDFGETLTIYGDAVGNVSKVVIAHRRGVLCRLIFGW